MDTFATGTLREQIRRATARAVSAGALNPIDTRIERIEDEGIGFAVRIADNLRGKSAAGQSRPRDFDPFLPYDEDLWVADASPTHVCLLNKFQVLAEHLLIVTRAFEDQNAPLGEEDFIALHRCIGEFPSLGFYNSGPDAGASQRHKHMQVVPLPLCDWASLPLPFDRLAALGIPHQAAAAPASGWTVAALLQAYREKRGTSQAYNLLVTSTHLIVVPRRQESAANISINALGFVGSFFVPDEAAVASVRSEGPANLLRRVVAS